MKLPGTHPIHNLSTNAYVARSFSDLTVHFLILWRHFLIFDQCFLDLRPNGGNPVDIGFSVAFESTFFLVVIVNFPILVPSSCSKVELTLLIASNSSTSFSGSWSFSTICLIMEMRSCFLVVMQLIEDDGDSFAETDFKLFFPLSCFQDWSPP